MKNLLLPFLLLLVIPNSYAQKLKMQQGKIQNLKGITEYNLVFDYSDLEIPKYNSEGAFLEDKIQKREVEEVGAGEKFKKSWFADRENRYEPKFKESFDKRFDEGKISIAKNNTNAQYTMEIHTTLMYAGYNVGVWRENAKIDALITVYETHHPDHILFSGKYLNVQGNGAFGFDYDSGYRISEAYAKLAKSFAGLIKKKAK